MRLFIAFDLNDEKEYFKQLQKQMNIDNAKLSFADSYHLTLKFLGEIEERMIPELIKRLEPIKFKNIKFNLSDVGFFKNRFGINVIWQGIEPKEDAISLKEKVDEVLRSDFHDDFQFTPHITLARVRYVEDEKSLVKNIKELRHEHKEVEICHFYLIQSNITKEGVSYNILHSFNMK